MRCDINNPDRYKCGDCIRVESMLRRGQTEKSIGGGRRERGLGGETDEA